MEITIRDDAIERICSNLMWAGILLPSGRANYILYLQNMNDGALGVTLGKSIRLLSDALERAAIINRN